MNKATTGLLLLTVLIATVAVFLPNPVGATSTGTKGQPNQSCQSVFPSRPLQPRGFNTGGFAKAGTVYAGSGQNTQTPANSHAVAQYDVACFQQGQH